MYKWNVIYGINIDELLFKNMIYVWNGMVEKMFWL